MRNNSLYLQFKSAATGYSIAQIKAATDQQAINLIGGLNKEQQLFVRGFFPTIKARLLIERIAVADNLAFTSLKQQVKAQIEGAFPNVEFETGKENGKRFVKVWIDGRAG